MRSEGIAIRNDKALFFSHWLRKPLGIGAALPSSIAVGHAMGRGLTLEREGAILELGGGTGSLTQGLIDAGCPADRLVVVEREPELVGVLQRRFPGVQVLCADAREVAALLSGIGVRRLATVVSSLPIKWLPLEAQRNILEPCLALLGSGGSFLQMTNALTSPIHSRQLGIHGEEIARIWTHFPPVQIWRYWRPAAPGSARPAA